MGQGHVFFVFVENTQTNKPTYMGDASEIIVVTYTYFLISVKIDESI